ncbi:MAG: hypothetical protein KBS55_05170 [Bacteroidales bacterium]|nr:hypothetical protein [Candidatus Cryptobacteroides aphodequi]
MKKLIICLAAVLACAISYAADPVMPTIVAIGDSNGQNEFGWANSLRDKLPDARVINKSRSGRTLSFTNQGKADKNGLLYTPMILEELDALPYATSIKYIILNLGTNDALVQYADRTDLYKPNLTKLVKIIKKSRICKKYGAELILMSPFPVNENAPKFKKDKYEGAAERTAFFAEQMEQVAAKSGVRYLNVRGTVEPLMNRSNCADGIHLNAELSAVVADEIIKFISE